MMLRFAIQHIKRVKAVYDFLHGLCCLLKCTLYEVVILWCIVLHERLPIPQPYYATAYRLKPNT